VGREKVFNPTIGNESLHRDIIGNVVIIVNFATSKILGVNSTQFPHRDIHKYTWTSPDRSSGSRMWRCGLDRAGSG